MRIDDSHDYPVEFVIDSVAYGPYIAAIAPIGSRIRIAFRADEIPALIAWATAVRDRNTDLLA